MKAFDIKVDGKIFDYRIGKNLDLDNVKYFFGKRYIVKKIWQEKRHVVGVLEKEGKEYFLKLAPTEGISQVTQIEYRWNKQFNQLVKRTSNFWVPENFDSGFYKENLFYMVTDYFDGKLFANRPTVSQKYDGFKNKILKIIELSEMIQTLEIEPLSEKDNEEYLDWFLEKTKSWLNEVPEKMIQKFEVNILLKIVTDGYKSLDKKTRHGDFTPWHMFDLGEKIGLIDGEHAMKNGVEYYDIAYLIQRVFSVLGDIDFAKVIFETLKEKNYNLEKLKVLLAARAIGGFCDETLIADNPNFERANKFKDWVLSI